MLTYRRTNEVYHFKCNLNRSVLWPRTWNTPLLQVLQHRLDARLRVQPKQNNTDGSHVADFILPQPCAGKRINLQDAGHTHMAGQLFPHSSFSAAAALIQITTHHASFSFSAVLQVTVAESC